MEMFHSLNWYSKHYCNYNKYFFSFFSFLVWTFFFSNVEIVRFYCRIGMEIKNFHTKAKQFTHQRRKISASVWKVVVHGRPGQALCLQIKEQIIQNPVGVVILRSQVRVLAVTLLRFLSYNRNKTFRSFPAIGANHFQTRVEIKGAKYSTFGFYSTFIFWCGNCSLLLRQCICN